MTRELPHRKATQTTLILPMPHLITERVNVQEKHIPVPGSEHLLESRTTLSKVLPALQSPAWKRAGLWGAFQTRFPHLAVSHPLRSGPGPPSLSWNTSDQRVHLPGPGYCANSGYLSQVGGRRGGCLQEAACAARYVAVLGSEGRSRDCAFSPRIETWDNSCSERDSRSWGVTQPSFTSRLAA